MGEQQKKSKQVKPKQVKWTEQPPKERIKNFKEVAFVYTPEEAQKEASRCLQCKKPLCIGGCPVEVDIPGFVKLIEEGDFKKAASKIRERNVLPAICGRVCPQENQCQEVCVLAKKQEPLAIGKLERFAADWLLREGESKLRKKIDQNKPKVAVVGSGPAGLTVAGDLARLGYPTTIFEGLHLPGGVLTYGIPEFRLPNQVVEAEIDLVKKLGVEIKLNAPVGALYTIDELLSDGYKTVFVGVGAGLPVFMGVPGENLNGVYSANEFLTRVNLMRADWFPEFDTPVRRGRRVVVIGGGNVAMDSARTALRLEAKEVYLLYRRTEKEMPARDEEIEHAREEGIIFKTLASPIRFLGKDGFVSQIDCQEMKLGEPDESGRRRPIPIKGSHFIMDADVVVVAVGTRANPLILQSTPGLKLTDRGYIEVDERGQTSREGVFAGGDIISGSATVISAMGAGRKAAQAIDEYLSGKVGSRSQ